MFPRIPTWALGVTAAVLGLGVIPIAAFESWRQTVLTTVGAAPTITLLAAMAVLAFGAIWFHRHQIKAMERALDEMRTRLAAAATEDAPDAPWTTSARVPSWTATLSRRFAINRMVSG